MKQKLTIFALFALALVSGLAGCGDPAPASDEAMKKLDAMAPEARFDWVKRMTGVSLQQKYGQIDAIKGATEEQKKAWKDQLATEGGGAPAAAPGNPLAGQRAPQGN